MTSPWAFKPFTLRGAMDQQDETVSYATPDAFDCNKAFLANCLSSG